MNLLQIEATAIVIAMLGMFMWDLWRYDVVAAAALLAAIATGVVKPEKAFEGFAHPVIVIIASVLIVGRAIARSKILDSGVRALMRRARSTSLQIGALAACVAILSALIKNVGTLGIFLPIAIQTARRAGRSPSLYLMPMSFASLIGGTMTLVGTSPNILVSSIRAQEGGAPFRMFDFLWVGLPLTLVALVFLTFGWRLLPRDRQGKPTEEEQFDVGRYMTELEVAKGSAAVGRSVGYVEDREDGDLIVTAIVRNAGRHFIPSRNWRLVEGDVLVVQSSPDVVKAAIAKEGLELAASKRIEGADETPDDMATVEAIVSGESPLVGRSAETMRLRQRYEINLLAVSRNDSAARGRLHAHVFRAGDVAVFQGFGKTINATLGELGCLPLADRNLELGRAERGAVSLGVLAVAIALMVANFVNVEVAFFGAAVAIILLNQITLKSAYGAIEGPVIVMLACLLPLGEALKDVGVTHIVATHLTGLAAHLPALLAIGFVLLISMLVTPVMHHAPAVLVMGPIAAELAKSLHYNPDPFLMAVALGAACDFLSPIGHQNNLLVKEPGGYRFGDYWKLGLPLSLLVLAAGTPLIFWAWPTR
ncbi:MAG: SLC13 family permease [Hyphomicrobiales bacterium]|nr:SLC13 family permease [Hyphomicrobiales bacterium]